MEIGIRIVNPVKRRVIAMYMQSKPKPLLIDIATESDASLIREREDVFKVNGV